MKNKGITLTHILIIIAIIASLSLIGGLGYIAYQNWFGETKLTAEDYTFEEHCKDKGYYWYDEACHSEKKEKQKIDDKEEGEKEELNLNSTKLLVLPDWAEKPGCTFSPNGRRVACIVQKEEKEAVITNNEEGEFYDEIEQGPIFSSNSNHVAYVAKKEGEYFTMVDGEESGPYGLITKFTFSPDGEHFAYIAAEGFDGKYFAVLDGKKGKKYDYISQDNFYFSPDSENLVYVAEEGKPWEDQNKYTVVNGKEKEGFYTFSHNGERTAHVVERIKGSSWVNAIFVDGKEQEEYKKAQLISNGTFSPNNQRLAYVVSGGIDEEEDFVVVEGKEGKHYESGSIKGLTFSSNSKHYAYYVDRFEEKDTLVVDGEERGNYGHIGNIALSPNGQRVAVYASDSKEYPGSPDFIDINGKQINSYEPGTGGFESIQYFVFSPDSQRFAYRVKDQGASRKSFIVVDGEKGEPYTWILGGPVFSPDSNHVASIIGDYEKGAAMLVDGQRGKYYDQIYSVARDKGFYYKHFTGNNKGFFTPDSNKLYYGAKIGNELWWKVQEIK